MFDAGFALLFRAVDRIRKQLATADADLRRYLAEELYCLRQLGEQYIDHWMTLEEQIIDLIHTYDLPEPASPAEAPVAAAPVQAKASGPGTTVSRTAHAHRLPAPAEPAVRLAAGQGHKVDPPPAPAWAELGFDDAPPVSVQFRKGLGYFDLAMFRDAAAALEQVVQEAETPLARLYLAASYAAEGRSEDAMAQLEHLRKYVTDPLVACAMREIEAQIHLAAGRTELALQALARVTAALPKYPDAWFNLSLCYAKLGDLAAAERCAALAFALDPCDAEAACVLAAVQFARNHITDAENTCRQALSYHPRHADLMLLTAHLHRVKGEWDACARACQAVIRAHPDAGSAWSLLAWVRLQQGKTDEAQALLQKRLAACREDAAAMVQLGVVLLLAGDLDRAERVLTRCLAKYPNKSLVWIALGKVSLERGEPRKAHTRFLRAAKDTRPAVRRLALYWYGRAMLDAGCPEQAERYLKAAAAWGAPNAAILSALAETAERLGRPLEAEKWQDRARQLKSPDPS
ncbi:tetratricopeptide repeat protein [Alicyclobacillus macrosporangiidus]|uniref:tetratricopeptide repeat protein n=1 Tax=Alicyclobacillus macrosporangiidus TaxID=392015 RepID=UPI000496EA69|nr:tetratricopeptide repeat protein [Alicyclobacillus macrosporangiidus]